MRFPKYDYDDMVEAQHRMLTEGLGIDHMRLIMGTSMGCMMSFVWGETYPGFSSALMPLACEPIEIAGLNRMWRQMVIDGIEKDPSVAERQLFETARTGPSDGGIDPFHRRRSAAQPAEGLSDAGGRQGLCRAARRERDGRGSTRTT